MEGARVDDDDNPTTTAAPGLRFSSFSSSSEAFLLIIFSSSTNPSDRDAHQMNITVKAAHCFVSSYRYQRFVRNSLIKHLHELPIAPVIYSLQKPGFQIPNCSLEHEAILDDCDISGDRFRHSSPSVTLRVEPRTTIGALKSMLESEPWIPNENLVLVKHKKRPLEDNSILSECGLKVGGGSLLACMGGSFTLTIHHVNDFSKFHIPISSCFETFGDLKEKILRVTGISPEKQILEYNFDLITKKENTRLVALGMVRPYSTDLPKNLNNIYLFYSGLE